MQLSFSISSYSVFRGNINTDEVMNVKSSSCSNILLAVALNSVLFCCDESGMVTPPCCHTFLVSDVFCGFGLSNFCGSTEDDKILRPIKSSSYRPLDSESQNNKQTNYSNSKITFSTC